LTDEEIQEHLSKTEILNLKRDGNQCIFVSFGDQKVDVDKAGTIIHHMATKGILTDNAICLVPPGMTVECLTIDQLRSLIEDLNESLEALEENWKKQSG
jgi:hypothetical protein